MVLIWSECLLDPPQTVYQISQLLYQMILLAEGDEKEEEEVEELQ